MTPSGKPSIFTPRESFYKRPVGDSRTKRTHSPLRRQSTPEAIERSRLQAAAEAALPALKIPATPEGYVPVQPQNTAHHTDRVQGLGWTESSHSQTRRHSISLQGASLDPSANTRPLRIVTPTFEQPPPFGPPRSAESARKRPGSANYEPSSEPLLKRRNLGVVPRSKHFLDGSSFRSNPVLPPGLEPPSPLFFSNTPRSRPTLPPRFSSSEAAAKMLSKARMEDSHMKNVSLPRGVVAVTPGATQNPTSAPHFLSRGSAERRSGTRSTSPEVGTFSKDVGNMLSSIGIIELLEQDERPTFIVDLSEAENYGSGPLKLVFANSSLRSYTGLESLISGRSLHETTLSPGLFLQFKSWLLGASLNGESLDVCLPTFVFSNMSWSCSTLRKKLRIISGAFVAIPSAARRQLSNPPVSSPMAQQEPSDYFGAALAESPATPTSARTDMLKSRHHAEATPEQMFGLVSNVPTPEIAIPTPSPRPVSKYNRPMDNRLGVSRHGSSDDSSYETNSMIDTRAPDAPCFDWTRLPCSDAMPPHIQFARNVDWGATALGPIETWASDLRQMCNLIMASPHPAAMYWGPDFIAIYNEAYISLAGQKHPKLMGQSYREAWAEIWNEVKDVFASAQNTGEATMKDDDCLFIRRSDYLEETYFSWSIIPMVGRHGSVMGLYNPCFEKTRRKIAERRMLTLREVGERTASARDVKGFWAQVLDSFEFNEYDSPFLLLYSVGDDGDSDTSSIHSSSVLGSRQCFLEGKLGVPDSHPAGAENIDLKSGVEGFGPAFREAMKTDKPVLLDVGTRELPETLVEGLEWRGFGDPVKSVVVCPIHPTTGENILGFLVLGVNPRRPYDDDYSLFVQLLSRQLATSLASVVLFEEEIRRGQRAAKLAAIDRIELSEKLAQRTQEAMDSETKFSRMAEFAPVGIVIADRHGRITFANDTWYDLSRVPRNGSAADSWMDFVKPEDLDLVKTRWQALTVEKKAVSSEFRFKTQWRDRNGSSEDTWVLLSGFPEKYEDGELKSVFACFTNISQQKWAEGLQKRKMEEAMEHKRQQENFIDITSHEVRNPLSAILQCSDEITTTLTKCRQTTHDDKIEEAISTCLEAAQTISLCSQHQKRIVDDVLTLSKLDSQLLLVTPVDAQPITVVQRALKMHESELQASDIKMSFIVDSTYHELGLDWVKLDPSRVLQVLLNLTGNAIKFTGPESRRTISITISATEYKPGEGRDGPVSYFPSRRKDIDVVKGKDWGDGELVYVHFAVRDTGRGLNVEEKKLLFQRFSQASPRTHVQYGGSGLGLFISRELTELQGGQIGVESIAGQGSTFAFYIVARRSTAPADANGGPIVKTSSSQGAHKGSPTAQKSSRRISQASAKEASASPKPEKIKRVLIVEDNLVNQRVLHKQLKNVGAEVHLANHGGEALERLQQSTYWTDASSVPQSKKIVIGVVLMDQEMPVMDGLTCTRNIRQWEKEGKLKGHVPIIAVTANARAEQIQTALAAGMDDVVSKPFRITDLVPKIEELLEKYPAPLT